MSSMDDIFDRVFGGSGAIRGEEEAWRKRVNLKAFCRSASLQKRRSDTSTPSPCPPFSKRSPLRNVTRSGSFIVIFVYIIFVSLVSVERIDGLYVFFSFSEMCSSDE